MSTHRQHVAVVVALVVAVAASSAHVTYTQFIRFTICARTASNASLNGLIYCYGSWRCIMSRTHTHTHTRTVAHMSAHTHVAGNKEMTTKLKAKPIQCSILFSALSHQHTHMLAVSYARVY